MIRRFAEVASARLVGLIEDLKWPSFWTFVILLLWWRIFGFYDDFQPKPFFPLSLFGTWFENYFPLSDILLVLLLPALGMVFIRLFGSELESRIEFRFWFPGIVLVNTLAFGIIIFFEDIVLGGSIDEASFLDDVRNRKIVLVFDLFFAWVFISGAFNLWAFPYVFLGVYIARKFVVPKLKGFRIRFHPTHFL